MARPFIAATEATGLAFNPDFNGAEQEGVGLYQLTTRGGRRLSAARAFLRPAMGRRNLAVETHAHVTRVLFAGRRAVGVDRGGHHRQADRGAVEEGAQQQRRGEVLLERSLARILAADRFEADLVLEEGQNGLTLRLFVRGIHLRRPRGLRAPGYLANMLGEPNRGWWEGGRQNHSERKWYPAEAQRRGDYAGITQRSSKAFLCDSAAPRCQVLTLELN